MLKSVDKNIVYMRARNKMMCEKESARERKRCMCNICLTRRKEKHGILNKPRKKKKKTGERKREHDLIILTHLFSCKCTKFVSDDTRKIKAKTWFRRNSTLRIHSFSTMFRSLNENDWCRSKVNVSGLVRRMLDNLTLARLIYIFSCFDRIFYYY